MTTRRLYLGAICLAVVALAMSALLTVPPVREAYRTLRRQVADIQLAYSLQTVPCPQSAYVVLALGQSNAGNHVGRIAPAAPNLPAYAFFRDRCIQLSDPLPGATGSSGSLWTLVGQQLAAKTGKPVVVIAAAAGGSMVEDWNLDRYSIVGRAERSIKGAVAVGLVPDVVVWVQGESDSGQKTAEADYVSGMLRVATRLNQSMISADRPAGPRWIVSLTSRCGADSSRSDVIRAAQVRTAQSLPLGHVGPDTDSLGAEFRSDGCHFNAAGQTRLAKKFSSVLSELDR